MKYLPTININHEGVYEALASGQLRLQCGQWIVVNPGDKPSRWVGRTKGGVLNVVHPSGAMNPRDCRVSKKDFSARVAASKPKSRALEVTR